MATLPPATARTPDAPTCIDDRERRDTLIGMVRHHGEHDGDKANNARFDVNHDGRIDARDVIALMREPSCGRRGRGGDHRHAGDEN